MSRREPRLVSVIISCYNYGHFLAGAIESALNQTYTPYEIIVVDDGSSDNTADVVARYQSVCYLRQPNRGVSAARNNGLRQSKGEYVVFLDADDELLPGALEVGAECLDSMPDCGFVFGSWQLIAPGGMPTTTEMTSPPVDRNHYPALLRRNYIWNPGAVMHRRTVVESVGGFNTSLPSCEDFDLYLRVTRDFPVHYHGRVVVKYRLHGANKSANPERMLKSVLSVIRSQHSHAKGDKKLYKAYKEGLRFRQAYNGRRVVLRAYSLMRRGGPRKEALRSSLVLMKCYPRGFAALIVRYASKLLQVTFRRVITATGPGAQRRRILR
jgi:glycosyltransferase involved in cell wall biosynthesis